MEKYLFNVLVNNMDIWLFRFSTVQLILPTLVFHNTWVRKKRKQAPYEILNLLYNLWCLFCFKEKLQMQVDGAWEKDIKTTVCVCVRACSPETGAWLTLEIDGVTVSSPVQ